MKTLKYLGIVLILIVGLFLVACQSTPETQEDETGSNELPPAAVVKAREVLAEELNVDLEAVAIESYERMEWSDSCLGLGGAAESCLAAIHPGWRVMLSVDEGNVYEVRTDELGEIIRIKE